MTIIDKQARQADIIEIAIIALTTLTSGAFWALASDALPKQMAWIGAVISTFTTFLTIILYAIGFNRKRGDALRLYGDLGRFLAVIQGNPNFKRSAYYMRLKEFDDRIKNIKIQRS